LTPTCVEPICAVLSKHGIKIAPSIYYARVMTPITLAERAEASRVKRAAGSAFGPRLWGCQAGAAAPALSVGRDKVGRLIAMAGAIVG
jgi:hypothetical protein